MPYQISADHEKRIIRVDLTGVIDLKQILAYIAGLMEEPFLSLPYGILIDHRKASLADMSVDDIVKILWMLNAGGDKVKPSYLAMLTASPLVFGFHRAFAMMAESENMPLKSLVTDDEKKALQWAMNSPEQH